MLPVPVIWKEGTEIEPVHSHWKKTPSMTPIPLSILSNLRRAEVESINQHYSEFNFIDRSSLYIRRTLLIWFIISTPWVADVIDNVKNCATRQRYEDDPTAQVIVIVYRASRWWVHLRAADGLTFCGTVGSVTEMVDCHNQLDRKASQYKFIKFFGHYEFTGTHLLSSMR